MSSIRIDCNDVSRIDLGEENNCVEICFKKTIIESEKKFTQCVHVYPDHTIIITDGHILIEQ